MTVDPCVLITTVPFGAIDRGPLDLLEAARIRYVINSAGRRLTERELADIIGDYTVVIAGTEPITAKVMDQAPHLRLIARVGIGLDNVDLLGARERGIAVTYTPEAPSLAVAEFTIGLMLSLLRFIPHADQSMKRGVWRRFMGRRLGQVTVGVLGVGRVGKGVIRLLKGFGPRIIANDLVPDTDFGAAYGVEWTDKERVYRDADIITLHLPLTHLTRNLISRREMEMMKRDALLINTSRGGIVNEHDLAEMLAGTRLGGAALDVFEEEPYSGKLAKYEDCLITCHMGSMSQDCRARMELERPRKSCGFSGVSRCAGWSLKRNTRFGASGRSPRRV